MFDPANGGAGRRLDLYLLEAAETAPTQAAVWTNQTLSFTRAVGDMIILAQAIAKGGLVREESRGSHYRLDFPDRDDERFHKTTIAHYAPDEPDSVDISFRDVRANLIRLRARTYGKTSPKKTTDKPATAGAV